MFHERVAYSGEDEYPYDQVKSILVDSGVPFNGVSQLLVELFPFFPNVIEAIAEQTRGNPRDILRACAWLIDVGYDQQKVYDDVDETLEVLGLRRQEGEAV